MVSSWKRLTNTNTEATINSQLDQDEKIKIRIELTQKEFVKYGSMLTNRTFLVIRLKFLESYVWCQLLYGVETWTLKTQSIKKLT